MGTNILKENQMQNISDLNIDGAYRGMSEKTALATRQL